MIESFQGHFKHDYLWIREPGSVRRDPDLGPGRHGRLQHEPTPLVPELPVPGRVREAEGNGGPRMNEVRAELLPHTPTYQVVRNRGTHVR